MLCVLACHIASEHFVPLQKRYILTHLELTSHLYTVLSEQQVHAELNRKEEEHLANGGLQLHKTSAAQFVEAGLVIEESQ